MCGIAGSILQRGTVDAALLAQQRDLLAHRGPDGHGLWISADGRVGLAHRRLAIIDLSPGGHQPMIDPHTGTVVTFNGEIYNYQLLRARLQALGAVFQTASDTEVLLAAYAAWGDDCVREFDGMFAFVLYDPRQQRVLMARDRAGEKPLFLRHAGDGLHFASEVKALLADPTCPRRASGRALNEFLAYGYTTGATTLFDGITRLPPGHRLTITLDTGVVQQAPYWTLPEPSVMPPPSARAATALVDELESLLTAAVKRQLTADVPIGVLLSGGVDSSLITALAARAHGGPVRTFTVRVPGHPAFDEGPQARLVAEHCETVHHELEAAPPTPALLEALVDHYDEPIADASMLPTFLVSQAIRAHATVALGGDGGDELFGGYWRYPAQLRQAALRRWRPPGTAGLLRGVARLWPSSARGRGWMDALAGDVGTSLANAGRIFRDDERRALTPVLRGVPTAELRAPERRRWDGTPVHFSVVQRATRTDYATYLPDDILAKVDRASMSASLEVRAPFLDPSVTAFAFGRLPDALRATVDARKVILRQLGARLLPPTLDMTRKQGFSIPVADWLRGPWRPMLDAAVHDARPSLVTTTALRAWQQRLDQGAAVGDALFALLVLRRWEQTYRVTDVVP